VPRRRGSGAPPSRTARIADPPITIRQAEPGDAGAIAAIHNQGIEERIATFETREQDGASAERRLGRSRPLLVAEQDGEVVGWAGEKLVAKIFVDNEPSLQLFAAEGFRRGGTHERHATLDGEWKDVVVVEKLL
jgi:L-amino acid N-acyltransferase YncA